MRIFSQRPTNIGQESFNNPNVKYKPDKKIVAVDFDGTLVFNDYPFISNPNIELIEFIKAHMDNYTWILWTCREGEQLKQAVEYLKDNFNLRFDFVNDNASWHIEKYRNNCRKVFADYYIDEKNFQLEWLDFLKANTSKKPQNAI